MNLDLRCGWKTAAKAEFVVGGGWFKVTGANNKILSIIIYNQ